MAIRNTELSEDKIVQFTSTERNALKWAVSSAAGIDSDFSFPAAPDRFYNPHDAQLVDGDALLLFDGGNNRPRCDQGGEEQTRK